MTSRDPEEIIERMEKLIEDIPSDRDTTPIDEDVGPMARKHRDAIQRGAER